MRVTGDQQHTMTTLLTYRLARMLMTQAHRVVGRAWRWLGQIESDDPVRRSLNRSLAPIYPLYTVIAAAVAPTYEDDWRRSVAFAAGLLCLLGLLLNRRGVAGPVVLTACATAGITLLMPPETYLVQHGALSLPGELLMPIVIAALFVSPRAGGITCASVLAAVSLNALAAGAQLEAVVRFNLLSGSTLVAITALLVVGAGQFTRALRHSHEANRELERRVTERTAALAEANGALADAKLRVEQVAELRVKEVTEVVHDARNQIMHIRAAADHLAETEGDRHGARRTIDAALRSQQDMLDALLEAALIDAGTLVLYREPASLTDLVQQAVEQVRPRYEQRGCALTLVDLVAIPPVTCDARRIKRVLLNVLNNALSYTASYRKDGGAVLVEVSLDGGQALVRVSDNGVGIARDQLPLIGQRMVRAVSGRSAPEGTGLGLSASIEVIRLHGGQLQLRSDGIGLGTTAELRLPLGA